MRCLIFFIPLFLYSSEYFAKIEPLQNYTISSKISGLVTFTNDKLISHTVNDNIIVKIDDEISKINYDLAKATYEIKKNFYYKIKNLSSKTKTQKDNEKLIFLNAKQAYLKAKDDLQSRKIYLKNLYLEKILVKKGTYVNPGTPLIQALDLSKGKLIIYVNSEDIKDIKNKKILVNGKSGYKVLRYFKTTDSVQVSSYKVILVGDAPEFFSQIAKVEIK